MITITGKVLDVIYGTNFSTMDILPQVGEELHLYYKDSENNTINLNGIVDRIVNVIHSCKIEADATVSKVTDTFINVYLKDCSVRYMNDMRPRGCGRRRNNK